MSLQLARERAAEARALLARDIDPRQKRKQDKLKIIENQTNTFRVTAEEWYQSKIKAGRTEKTLSKIRTYLDRDILSLLGDKSLTSISRADCAEIQERVENRGALSISRIVRQYLSEIFSYAIAKGRCENNVASELKSIALPMPDIKPYPHLLEPELPDFLKMLDRTTSGQIIHTTTRLAILRELWSETRDERFFRLLCIFHPWPEQGEIVALTGHLAEGELHSRLTFIERALGIERARNLYEQELGRAVSQAELARHLSSDG